MHYVYCAFSRNVQVRRHTVWQCKTRAWWRTSWNTWIPTVNNWKCFVQMQFSGLLKKKKAGTWSSKSSITILHFWRDKSYRVLKSKELFPGWPWYFPAEHDISTPVWMDFRSEIFFPWYPGYEVNTIPWLVMTLKIYQNRWQVATGKALSHGYKSAATAE